MGLEVSYPGPLAPQIGGSGNVGTGAIIANVNTTPVGTISNTAETDLMTYTLPANTLNANNLGVRITAWGSANVAANNETIKMYFGSGTLLSLGPSAFGSGYWRIEAIVIRTSSNNQSAGVNYDTSAGIGAFGATTTQTDTAGIVIKVTGQNGVATVNGVQQAGMVIEVINVPGSGTVNPYLPASLANSTDQQALVPMGTSGSTGVVPSVANVNTTPVGTISNTAETDLMTYTLPANALSANRKGVRITAWGTSLAAANNQTLKMYFGGTAFTQTGPSAFGTGVWSISGTVIRTGSNAQVYYGSTLTSNLGGAIVQGTLAITDTSSIVIKCTGQNGVATVDGVKQTGLLVEFIN